MNDEPKAHHLSLQSKQTVTFWTDIVFKVGTPLVLLSLFFLKSSFATKDEFQAMVSTTNLRLTKVETAIQLIVEKNSINERQQAELADHEARLRALEQKTK